MYQIVPIFTSNRIETASFGVVSFIFFLLLLKVPRKMTIFAACSRKSGTKT